LLHRADLAEERQVIGDIPLFGDTLIDNVKNVGTGVINRVARCRDTEQITEVCSRNLTGLGL